MNFFLSQNDPDIVRGSLRYLNHYQAIYDSKIETPLSETDELVPSFNFKVYQIDILRRMKKRYGKRMSKEPIY